MKLTALKPRVGTVSTSKVKTLMQSPGVTERPNGRRWTETRKRVALAQGYRCVDCRFVWTPNRDEVDHDTPLEQGGSNDDSNLRLRCLECHAAKTAREAAERATRRAGL